MVCRGLLLAVVTKHRCRGKAAAVAEVEDKGGGGEGGGEDQVDWRTGS